MMKLRLLLGLLAGGGWLIGCANQPTGSANSSASYAATSHPYASLRKGMTADEVRQMLGEPRSIRPFRAAEVQNETWTYRQRVETITTTEATRTREVPYHDPISNSTRMITEPDYQPLVINVDEVATLLFIEGRLAEWRIVRESNRDYN